MGLLVGVAVGATGCWLCFRHLAVDHVFDDTCAAIADKVNTLTLAREKQYDRLVEEGEAELALYISALSAVTNKPGASLSNRQIKFLLSAERYYQKYPVATGDTNRDGEIVAFLQSLSGSNTAPLAPR